MKGDLMAVCSTPPPRTGNRCPSIPPEAAAQVSTQLPVWLYV